MGQEKVLDWGELRVLISLTGHSFERSRGRGIVEKLTSEKKDCVTYLSIRRQLSCPRGIECLHLSHAWDYSFRMSFLLGGFSPDPDIDIASIVGVFFPLQPK